MKNIIKGIMGIVLIVISVGLIFYWEVYGRESILYDDVVVLTQEVKKSDVITVEMVTYEKREGNTIIEGAIIDARGIIGKAASCFIPKGAQLVEEYFEDTELVLSEDEYIFRVPNEWLKAYPNSLRRGDTIFFHEINTDTITPVTSDGLVNLEQYRPLAQDEAIASVTVAYAKDSANREVITLSEEERFNGSSKINEIEIIVDVETVNLLRKSIEDGKVFILMYQ